MKIDVGIVNGLMLGIHQETIYIIDTDEEGEETGDVEEGSAIHLHLLLFRVSFIFE